MPGRCGPPYSRAVSVYRDLRDLIVSGEVAPGTVVTEHQLAGRLSVSRTPVREALQRLAGDGLVSGRGRGVRVLVRSPSELAHVYRTRAALEAMAAQAAAERYAAGELAPAELRHLDDVAQETDRLTRLGDMTAAAVSNRTFHQSLSRLAGNPVALEILDRLWDQIMVSTRASLTVSDRAQIVAGEHEVILRCVREGDGSGAADAARAHVLSTLGAPSAV